MSRTAFQNLYPHSKVFVTVVNSDLTEGRGHSVVHSVHISEDAAELAAYGSDTMGSDGSTFSAPMGIGTPGVSIFTGRDATKMFGYASKSVAYPGPRYTRLSNIPDLTDEEWTNFARLVKVAGRNPLQEDDALRRERVRAKRETLEQGERKSETLFAVVTGTDSPLIAAVLDTKGNEEEAANVFVAALSQNSAWKNHRVVELFPGRTRDEMFGRDVKLPTPRELVIQLLGEHPDGTVFVIPGEDDEYILRKSVLFTADGHEADMAGLVEDGLRVRTESDIADSAYRKLKEMVKVPRH